jgi:superfamily II DNA helicase RecQ
MSYRVFTVPIQHPHQAEQEMNSFLRSHRVLSVERRWVENGENSAWAFCVDYLESPTHGPGLAQNGRTGNRNKVDYREKLSPEDFRVFARLREIRKEIAQADAVPVYTVFTNEQLARMVEGRVTTKAGLDSVAGVGDARVEKYGARVLEFLQRSFTEQGVNAAGQPSV